MPLTQKIILLRDRTRTLLVSAHDHFVDTQFAWNYLSKSVDAGATFSNLNIVTGTNSTQNELVEKSVQYIRKQLMNSTFQEFISIFEYWIFDLMRSWLLAYPRNLANRQLHFKEILDMPAIDCETIAMLLVDKELNEISYKKPLEWFDYLKDRTKIVVPAKEEIEKFTESKALRDSIVHNQGIAGKIYLQKAGALARFKEGDVIDITEPYQREVWELLLKLVADISDAVALKAV